MTVQTTTARVQYATNGTTGPWSVPFYFLAASHLKVVHTSAAGVETVLTLTTNYSVSGAGNPAGGSVTTVSAYAAGGTITVLRNVPALQETNYSDTDPFPAETHERALDLLTMLVQQLFDLVSNGSGGGGSGGGGSTSLLHTVRGPSTETLSQLPVAATRANKWLKFDASGNPSLATPADGTTISVFNYMSAAEIADVSTNTGALDVTAAVQDFLDACKYKTGYLEPGRYKITASLVLDHTASYCIRGAGCDITFQSGTTLMPTMNAPCIVADNASTDNFNPDIELSGFGICGNNAGTDQHGIYARRTPVDLKRLFIANCYHGVKLTYGYASTMHNCITANNYGHGVFLDRLANQVTMLHCISNANSRSGGGFAGIAVIGSAGFENLGVTLINCDTTSNGYGAGTPAGTQGVGVQVGHSRGVALIGHYGEHNKHFGVYADVTVRALTITGGFFTQEEVRCIDVKGLTITGTQFEAYDATTTKLTVQGGSGYGCDISGNSYLGGTHPTVKAFSRGAYDAVNHYATANPATVGWGGPWQVGDKVWNLSPANGAPAGWICCIAGNEAGYTGDWIPFGKIDATL